MSEEIAAEEAAPGLAALGLGGLASLRHLLGDSLQLLGLEARLAGLSLAGIIAAALAVAFSLMATWLLLQGALVLALIRLGLDALMLLLVFTALNAAASLGLLAIIRRLSRNLMFQATRQAVTTNLPQAFEEVPGEQASPQA
jgi:hypothetical protein